MNNYWIIYKYQAIAKFREKWLRVNLLGKLGVIIEHLMLLGLLALPLVAFQTEKKINVYNENIAQNYQDLKETLNADAPEKVIQALNPKQRKFLIDNLSTNGKLEVSDIIRIKNELNKTKNVKENVQLQFKQKILYSSITSLFALIFISFITNFTEGIKTDHNLFSTLLFTSSFSNKSNIFIIYILPLITKSISFSFFTFSFLIICQYTILFSFCLSAIIFLTHFLGMALGLVVSGYSFRFFLKKLSTYSIVAVANLFFIIFLLLIREIKIAEFLSIQTFKHFYLVFNQFALSLFLVLSIITPFIVYWGISVFAPYWTSVHEKPANLKYNQEKIYVWSDNIYKVVFLSIWKSIVRNPMQVTQMFILPLTTFGIFLVGFIFKKADLILFIGLIFTFVNIGFSAPNLFYKIKEADVYFYLSSYNFKKVQNIQNLSLFVFPTILIFIFTITSVLVVNIKYISLLWFIPFIWKIIQIKNEVILNEKINLFIYHIKRPKSSKNLQADLLILLCVGLTIFTYQHI